MTRRFGFGWLVTTTGLGALGSTGWLACDNGGDFGPTPGVKIDAGGGGGGDDPGSGAAGAGGKDGGGDADRPAGRSGKLAELNDQASPTRASPKEKVRVTGVVATSPRFQLSKSMSGTCLWGIFAADANPMFAPYSGILVVSKGSNAVDDGTGKTSCKGGDKIPVDSKPGDVLTIEGTYDLFGPRTCSGPSGLPVPAKQPQISSVTSITKTGAGTPPEPYSSTPKDLGGGSDALLKWSGGLVTIKSVEATSETMPGNRTFGSFNVRPQAGEGSVKIINKLYFRGPSTLPTVSVGDKFDAITGTSYLDFCTWSLAPRTLDDFDPKPMTGG